MKKIRATVTILVCISVLFFMTSFVFADDTTADDWITDGDTYVTSGNVGIGTTEPGSKIHIKESTAFDVELRLETTGPGNDSIVRIKNTNTAQGAQGAIYFDDADTTVGRISYDHNSGGVSDYMRFYTNNSHAMTIDNSGNVGIGTNLPEEVLDVRGGNILLDNNKAIKFEDTAGTNRITLWKDDSNDVHLRTNSNNDMIFDDTNSDVFMFIKGSSGDVGIGTTTPDYKLDVQGTIRAEEVKVETGWSDFVFEDNYNLPSLETIESFIKENKHLPDIPSAKEVKEQGLSVSEMMAKQMQKIEELTLYLIEMKKENEKLKSRITALEKHN